MRRSLPRRSLITALAALCLSTTTCSEGSGAPEAASAGTSAPPSPTAPAAEDAPAEPTGNEQLDAALQAAGMKAEADDPSGPGSNSTGSEVGHDRFRSAEISRDEALAWWPLRPILESPTMNGQADSGVQYLAKADGDHRRVDPRREPATLMVVYAPRATPWRSGSWDWIRSAGVLVGVTSVPSSVPAHAAPQLSESGEPVTVRGMPGVLDWGQGDQGAVRFHILHWLDQADDGTRTTWLVLASEAAFDKAGLLAWVEGLQEVG